MGHLRKITSLKDLPIDKVLISYLKEAVKLNADGVKLPPKSRSNTKKELVVPDYFTKLLKKTKRPRKLLSVFLTPKRMNISNG